ncbi:MAG: hypothetical protein JNN27_18140 [Planctomycetes bacterium]|nr:hypothetical protein [Planctomycetota bacterium]
MKFAALAACLLTGLARAQSTWYVDVSAVAPGVGTSASPYTSIQAAISQSSTAHGDTLVVAPGLYEERLLVNKRIKIVSSGGPLVTTLRPTVSGSTVRLNGTIDQFSATVLEGFTVLKRVGDSAPGVEGTSGTLRRCIVLGNGLGIGALTNYDLAVENCLITGHGIGMFSTYVNFIYGRNNIVVGNSTYDVDVSNADFSQYSCYGTGFFSSTPGLVTADPALRDPSGHDFHLLATSPCIDTGAPTSPLDPDGSRADMGPLVFDASYAPFSTYCTAKTNSQGCVPAIGASGTASFSSNQAFDITCTNELNNKLGLLFYGTGAHITTYQGGWLCVKAPTQRTAVIDSGGNVGPDDCSGVYAFDFNALIRSGLDERLVPGVTVYAQFWSRDPGASATTNRSDALRFTLAP